jgi:hypothetical protein
MRCGREANSPLPNALKCSAAARRRPHVQASAARKRCPWLFYPEKQKNGFPDFVFYSD